MGYSPEYLARRRREQRRRRRLLVAGGLVVILLAGGSAATYRLTRKHHVVVVRVAAKTHTSPTRTVETEYKAAPGAQSQKQVEADLAKAKHEHQRAAADGSSEGADLSAASIASFARLEQSVPGQLELAVLPLAGGEPQVLGDDEAAHAWSTSKVPVLVSLLLARGSEGLTSEERSWAESAIRESSNEAVLSLFGDLEQLEGGLQGASRYIESVLRKAGDGETVVATAPPPAGAVTTFGQTEWSPGEAVRFFRALALGCLLSSEPTQYVLNLMQEIEPSESWGLGSAGFSSVAFKGGWGPEGGGYLVRQSGIVDPGSTSSGVAVAIVNRAPDFASGTATLTTVARWLAEHLHLRAHAETGCTS